MENKWKNKNFKDSVKNAFNGIMYILKNERNFRIQIIAALLVIIASFVLRLELTEFAIIVLVIFLVWLLEFINSAIEIVIDMYTEEYNKKAKVAKDISAGAVTLTALMSVIIGIIIFLPKILKYIK